MIHKITDSLIIFVIVLIIFVGANQACKHNGGPKNPLLDNTPVLVIRNFGSTEGPTPLTVELDGSKSYSPDGRPVTYSWLFSDGEISDEPTVQHTFTSSGRHSAILVVTNTVGNTSYSDPIVFYAYGLANSPWPKFAHDQHNSGISENPGPMMNMENADSGGAFPKYWRGGIQNDTVRAVCIGYDGMVVYTQGKWLRARTPYGGVLWDIEFESIIKAWPAILHDGSIVAGTDLGWVHRVDIDGEIIWSVQVGSYFIEDIVLDTAINAGHDGTIYIGGYRRDLIPPEDTIGRLFAISLDGEIRWVKVISYSMWAKPVPTIGIDQNIIINGLTFNLYSPSGTLITFKHIADFFGPASVDYEGNITFCNRNLPMFNSVAEFQRQYLAPDALLSAGIFGFLGGKLAPVIDSNYANIVLSNDPEGSTLVTISDFCELSWITAPPDYDNLSEDPQSLTVAPGGISQDSQGIIYMAYQGIRAFSPPEGYPEAPYQRRHSLWAYSRPALVMTAPVIGEDGWLYVGCGDDILAIGD